mmetsp:Transcript_12335/g.38942  ORF Transcript_12335/g.38942 Transcript_12335/m.38942 type:complete len:275 (-) Transcript_12335:421-1245(-)
MWLRTPSCRLRCAGWSRRRAPGSRSSRTLRNALCASSVPRTPPSCRAATSHAAGAPSTIGMRRARSAARVSRPFSHSTAELTGRIGQLCLEPHNLFFCQLMTQLADVKSTYSAARYRLRARGGARGPTLALRGFSGLVAARWRSICSSAPSDFGSRWSVKAPKCAAASMLLLATCFRIACCRPVIWLTIWRAEITCPLHASTDCCTAQSAVATKIDEASSSSSNRLACAPMYVSAASPEKTTSTPRAAATIVSPSPVRSSLPAASKTTSAFQSI